MASWFFVLLICYVAVTGIRGRYAGLDFIGGVSIPQNLLVLSGFSALSFAGAKAITQSRVDAMVRDPAISAARADRAVGSDAATVLKIEGVAGPTRPRFPYDLLHDDEGRVDLGDFRALVVTMLAVVVYILTIFNSQGAIPLHRLVTLPDVDGTVLAAFGLGQGAYLAKKFVGDVGGGSPCARRTPDPNPSPPVRIRRSGFRTVQPRSRGAGGEREERPSSSASARGGTSRHPQRPLAVGEQPAGFVRPGERPLDLRRRLLAGQLATVLCLRLRPSLAVRADHLRCPDPRASPARGAVVVPVRGQPLGVLPHADHPAACTRTPPHSSSLSWCPRSRLSAGGLGWVLVDHPGQGQPKVNPVKWLPFQDFGWPVDHWTWIVR